MVINPSQKGRFRKVVMLLLALTILLSATAHPAEAHTIEPYIKEYVINPGQSFDDSFRFTNRNDVETSFQLSIGGYDIIKEIISDNAPSFITLKNDTITLSPGEEAVISYSLQIPASAVTGSYFNIIYLEEVGAPSSPGKQIGINLGFAMITAFHIVPEGSSLKDTFTKSTRSLLTLVERGIPYIKNTEIRFDFRNESNFVYKPVTEVRIFDAKTGELLYSKKPDELNDVVLPQRSSQTHNFEVDLYKYYNLTNGFKVVSRTYSDLDNSYVESVIEIPGYSPLVYVVSLLIPFILFWLLIKSVVRKRKSRTEKKEALPKNRNKQEKSLKAS